MKGTNVTPEQFAAADPMTRQGGWMQTYTGVQFWPMDPRIEEIRIEDIAHSLSLQCRYAGHCREFYSVAEHCVRVSNIVPVSDALWGLLHDASEAYLVDLPRPVKRYSAIGKEYRLVESALQYMICQRFGIDVCEPESVHSADDILLMTEKRDIMGPSPAKWREASEPLPEIIVPWLPKVAELMFLERFARLTSLRTCAQAPSSPAFRRIR